MRAPRPVRDSWSKVAILLAILVVRSHEGAGTTVKRDQGIDITETPLSGCCYLNGEPFALLDKVDDITTMVCEMLSAV